MSPEQLRRATHLKFNPWQSSRTALMKVGNPLKSVQLVKRADVKRGEREAEKHVAERGAEVGSRFFSQFCQKIAKHLRSFSQMPAWGWYRSKNLPKTQTSPKLKILSLDLRL